MTNHPQLPTSKRDAPDLLGGIAYQKFATLLAWLDLGDGDVLHIEKQEDYAVTRPGSGEVVQVRRTRGGLSLNTDLAHKTIQYAFNREESLVTVYWTTSPVQQERALRNTDRLGVELWSKAAEGDLDAAEAVRTLLLKRGGWSDELSTLLRESDPAELRLRLFRRLRWEVNRPSARSLEAVAKTRLQARIGVLRQGRATLARTVLPECLADIDRLAALPPEQRQADRNDLDVLIEGVVARIDNVAALGDMPTPARRGSPNIYALAERHERAAAGERLSRARERLGTGRVHGAIALVDEWLEQDAGLVALTAAALRFKAEVQLVLGDPEGAVSLAEEATRLDGTDDPLLECLILGARDPDAALARMGDDPELAWVRAEMLMKTGKAEQGLALLVDFPEDKDSIPQRRLRALLTAAAGDLSKALASVDAVVNQQEDVELTLAAASFHYALAQAKGVVVGIGDWPSPTSPALVQSSPAALQHLREAAALFERARQHFDDDGLKADKGVWRLACLVNLPDAQTEAAELAAELSQGTHPHPGAVHWALRRNLPIDLSAVEQALAARVDQASAEALVAYGVLLHHRDADVEAADALIRQRGRFDESDTRFIDDWVSRFTRDGPLLDVPRALALASESGDWSEIADEAGSEARPVEERFTLLQILAGEAQWAAVGSNSAFLVSLKTLEAQRLAVYAASHTVGPEAVVDLTSAVASLCNGAPPDDLQGMRIEALASVGRLPEAFVLLNEWTPSPSTSRMTEVRLRLNIGDLEGVASRAQALRLADLPADERVKIASQLAHAAPDQARALISTVDFSQTAIALAPMAFETARTLRLDRKARRAIDARLFSAEAEAAGVILRFDVRDLLTHAGETDTPAPATLYDRGELSLHELEDHHLGRAFTA